MRFNSIRTRLTLWYLLILATILIAFSIAVYVAVHRSLEDELDDSIQDRAAALVRLISFDESGRIQTSLDTNNPRLADSFQRLFDVSGNVVYDNSATYGVVPLDPAEIERARLNRRSFSTVDGGQVETRLFTTRLIRGDEPAGFLQIGESTADVTATQQRLLAILVILVPVGLALALGGGWWMSSRALRPIDEMTQTAREITEEDLSRRLNLEDLPDDEVGRLAHTFDEMIARLDAALQRQRQFTANASHELRTPLAAVQGQVDVALQQSRSPEAYQEVLQSVNEQLHRMTRLVEGILMLARFDARRVPLELEAVSVSSLIDSVAELMAPIAEKKGLSLRAVGGGTATISGDEALLLQLLLNLTDNAIKYTESGFVTLGWRALDGEIELFVEDTGPGISPDQIETIFEPFYRIDASRSGTPGSGLGLSISRWIAELHGGTISVASYSTGSRFTASFPTGRNLNTTSA